MGTEDERTNKVKGVSEGGRGIYTACGRAPKDESADEYMQLHTDLPDRRRRGSCVEDGRRLLDEPLDGECLAGHVAELFCRVARPEQSGPEDDAEVARTHEVDLAALGDAAWA
jgi:hypothetical protein